MNARWCRAMLLLGALALPACGPGKPEKPAGTTSDPVDVCEESMQVCRLDGSQLGVCTRETGGKLTCTSQH
jgi:hypothetical protein